MNCESSTTQDCNCIAIELVSECSIAYRDENCNGNGYSCKCIHTSYKQQILIMFMLSLWINILLFEGIKIFIVCKLRRIISRIRANPRTINGADERKLKCGIQSIGRSIWIRCIMCNATEKPIVLYMYHHGMLLRAGRGCLLFWQNIASTVPIFGLSYSFCYGFNGEGVIGSILIWNICVITNSLWLLIHICYCCGKPYVMFKIEEEMTKYKFNSDIMTAHDLKERYDNNIVTEVQPQ